MRSGGYALHRLHVHKELFRSGGKVFVSLKNQLYILIVIVSLFTVIATAQTEITSISQNADIIGRYEKFELTITVSESYSNPFDTDIVDITVTFTKPDGNDAEVPAFFYEEYDEDANGLFVNGRDPCWKVRLAPSQLGAYEVNQITIIDHNGTSIVDPEVTFTCIESNEKGIIRVDNRNSYYLQYDNNEPYIPIGHNVGWWDANGTDIWENTFTEMGSVGENWVRIWMTHFHQGTLLEWRAYKQYYGGVGVLSLPIAWKLDRMVESCEQNGISMQLVLQHHGQFSTEVNPNWDDNPYNIIHAATDGGFLNDPNEFFTDSEARRITKYKYRYIVARWGYSSAILAWELWNEVQYTDAWRFRSDKSSVVNWHNEMASYIRSTDPFNHPITSSSHGSGFENIWNLPGIDLIQVHYYGSGTIGYFEQTALSLASFNKPVIMGEFGTGTECDINSLPEPQKTQMLDTLELHNGIWSAFHVKSGGHLWWWDCYIEALDLYDEFTALGVYAENEDLADYNLARAQRAVSGAEAYFANPVLYDFEAESTQTIFTLEQDYFPGMENLSRWLHGSDKSAYKSDPNFHLNMTTAGSLRIHVESVSTWGNNSLKVLVNGAQVFSSSYANGSSNFIITVPLSAGQQSVQIENTGQDWFNINSYEFAPNNISFLDSVGLSGNERAFIWIYDTGSQYGQTTHGVFHNEPVIVKGLDDGHYVVDVFATRGTGGVIDSGEADSVSGLLTYTLPDFSKDIAVKVRPLCIVDFDDLAAFCSQWLQSSPDLEANLDGLGAVDFLDFSTFANYWLQSCPENWPL